MTQTPRTIEINSLKEKIERLEFTKKFSSKKDWFTQVYEGNIENIKKMIEYKIIEDIDIKDEYGQNALFKVCEYNKEDIVKLLIENGADINFLNDNGDNILSHACSLGCNTNIIELLIKSGVNINFLSTDGWTPLMCTAYCLDYNNAKLLIENGANVNLQNKDGNNVLMYINDELECTHEDFYNFVELLIESGADMKLKNNKGENFLSENWRHLNKFEIIERIEYKKEIENNLVKKMMNDVIKYNEKDVVITKFISTYLR